MSRLPQCLLSVAVASCTASLAHTVNLPLDLKDVAASVQTVKSGLTSPEGPGCDTAGVLYFCDYGNFGSGDTTGGIVYKLNGAVATPWVTGLNVPCGLVFDRQNRAIVSGWHNVLRIASPTQIDTLSKGIDLLEANDLSLTSDGGIFFTSNRWDSVGYVHYRSPNGTLTKVLSFPGRPNAVFPNGIEYVEERNLLYVCFSQPQNSGTVKKYAVSAQRTVGSPTNFVTGANPDGLALDVNYNVWLANSSEVSVFDSLGTQKGSVIIDGGGVTNCCFGGPDRQTLYITAGRAVYSLHTRIKGRKTTGELPVVARTPVRDARFPVGANSPAATARVRGLSNHSQGNAATAVTGRALQGQRPAASGAYVTGDK